MCRLWNIQRDRKPFKAFLWPSTRLSTTSLWQAHKLSIALSSLSLQDTHIGIVSLCFSPFIYFPPVLAPRSSHPIPFCTLHRRSLVAISLELKVRIFLFFSHHCLATVSTASQHTYFKSVCISLSV